MHTITSRAINEVTSDHYKAPPNKIYHIKGIYVTVIQSEAGGESFVAPAYLEKITGASAYDRQLDTVPFRFSSSIGGRSESFTGLDIRTKYITIAHNIDSGGKMHVTVLYDLMPLNKHEAFWEYFENKVASGQ